MTGSAGETLIGFAAVIAALGSAVATVIGVLNRGTVKATEGKLKTDNGIPAGQLLGETHAAMREIKPTVDHVAKVIDDRTSAFTGMPETFSAISKMAETFIPAFMEHIQHHDDPKEEK